MRKKILSIVAILGIAAIAAINVNLSSNTNFSNLLLRNIEALATIETDGIHNFQIGEKQIATGRKYSTTEPGWTWDVGLQVGLFHGKVSKGQPSSYTEESSSEIVKIKCCRVQGPEKECWYEEC